MVSFELGEELRKMFFVLSRAWDKEKILSPHEELNLRPVWSKGWIPHGDSEFFLCPMLVTRRKNIFLNSSLSSKLTISTFLSKTEDGGLKCLI